MVALYRRFRALTRDFFDEVDLLVAAADALAGGTAAAKETGPIVLFLPRSMPGPLADFVRRAAETRGEPIHAILGITGDAEADADILAAAAILSGRTVAPPETAVPTANRVISATDPEEEVREAMRQAMTLEGVAHGAFPRRQ